ncbi:hypothetical protein HFA01_04760 [Halobacillus faecis]|uniref:Uncharacterized protein n=1 Tax=Halobacillus faecis TaxID=360184 RepID=A0A511WM52_9BACI|nr:hypothetical protein HFA01_04760 [Halobacillus faecis]
MGTITAMARISQAMDTIMVKGRILLDMGTNMGIAHIRRAMDINKGMGATIPGMEGIITAMADFINPSLKKELSKGKGSFFYERTHKMLVQDL